MQSAVPDSELHQLVVESQRKIDIALAEQASLLADWDARGVWSADGSRSAPACLSRETGLSVGDARHLLHRAKRLQSMPLCAKAFAEGKLSYSRVDLLARANNESVREQFERDEQLLLDTIAPLRFSHAARVVQYWSHHADEASNKRNAEKLHEQRNAHVATTFEGVVDLRALFDPVGGEMFLNEHERLEKELFEEDWAEAKIEHGGDVRVEHLKRTSSQRRCDALVLMAQRSATAKTNGRGRVLISVVAGEQSFSRLCESASGTVLTPEQIVPLLSRADIERIVFDGPDRVLELGRQRSFTGALRRALEIRDRTCQHESGCDVPASKCEGDHITAFSRGGTTIQTNGQLLCKKHNRAKGSGPP